MDSDIVHKPRRSFYPVVRIFIKNRMLWFLTADPDGVSEATGGFVYMWRRAEDHRGNTVLKVSAHMFKEASWDEEDGFDATILPEMPHHARYDLVVSDDKGMIAYGDFSEEGEFCTLEPQALDLIFPDGQTDNDEIDIEDWHSAPDDEGNPLQYMPIFSAEALVMPCTEKRFNNECPICTEAFDSDETVIVALCGHRYHQACFDEGLDFFATCVYRCEGASGLLDRVCLERFKPVSEKIKLTIHMGKGKDVPIVTKLTASGESLHTTVRALTGADEGSFYLERAGTVKVIQDNADHLSFYGVEDEGSINFLMRGFGGGKRGAARAGSAPPAARTRMTMQLRIAELEEDIALNLVRLNLGAAQQPPAVRDLVAAAIRIGADFKNSERALDGKMAELSPDDRSAFSLALFSNNNLEERFKLMSEAFFTVNFEQLREVERQVQKSRELLVQLTSFGAYRHFGDEAGLMSWTKFVGKLNNPGLDMMD